MLAQTCLGKGSYYEKREREEQLPRGSDRVWREDVETPEITLSRKANVLQFRGGEVWPRRGGQGGKPHNWKRACLRRTMAVPMGNGTHPLLYWSTAWSHTETVVYTSFHMENQRGMETLKCLKLHKITSIWTSQKNKLFKFSKRCQRGNFDNCFQVYEDLWNKACWQYGPTCPLSRQQRRKAKSHVVLNLIPQKEDPLSMMVFRSERKFQKLIVWRTRLYQYENRRCFQLAWIL